MSHVIANSGIQFFETFMTFNPESAYQVPNDPRPLTITCAESYNPFTQQRMFSFLSRAGKEFISSEDLLNKPEDIMKNIAGNFQFDLSGLPIPVNDLQTLYYTVYNASHSDDGTECYSLNTMNQFRVVPDEKAHTQVPAFEHILDKWIPMPLFEQDESEDMAYPKGWCRIKISFVKKEKNDCTYRILWALDTTLASTPMDMLRPYMRDEDEKKLFGLCSHTYLLKEFFFEEETSMDGDTRLFVPSAEARYMARLLNIDLNSMKSDTGGARFKFLAFYAYLINLIRLVPKASLNITLHDKKEESERIPVDLVLDIGNSRTCGVLFENGDLTKKSMLRIRDLSDPVKYYDKPFDMRVVFRRVDLGTDIDNDPENRLFGWRSMLRVGEEAKKLVYRSIEDEGLSELTTNYSSPKRYIWDKELFDGKWNFLVTDTDPATMKTMSTYVDGLSEWLDERGNVLDSMQFDAIKDCRYSRSTLMMLAFLEIFNHALCQINSEEFRTPHANKDCPRYLRNVIITSPTAMANSEQRRLRQLAIDALRLASKTYGDRISQVKVHPSPENIRVVPSYETDVNREWLYDEATACQFVYMFAELRKRYENDLKTFFKLRGHKRLDLEKAGITDTNSVTVASVDIGAGTTDVMICAYTSADNQTLTPIPLFWDSFYLAGDDILENVVKNIIIEGPRRGDLARGSIRSVLEARMLAKNDAFFEQKLMEARDVRNPKPQYAHILDCILRAASPSERNTYIVGYCNNLLIDYFGTNSANNTHIDRRCRADFNTQISMPIAQLMMEQKRLDRPARTFTYEEVFKDYTPSPYLIEHFKNHFSFDIREIVWDYSPKAVVDQLNKTMKPLMKQISLLIHRFDVDVVMMAGRPTSLAELPDMLFEFYPVSPDRVVRLDKYEVGNWYPFATGDGMFYDQKSVVAVGAYIGYLASTQGYENFRLDLSQMASKMRPTANFVGLYSSRRHTVNPVLLSPSESTATVTVTSFPYPLGVKQVNRPGYESRPFGVIEYVNPAAPHSGTIDVQLTRMWSENPEEITILDATDRYGNPVGDEIRLVEKSLIDTETGDSVFWQDSGAFKYLTTSRDDAAMSEE